MDEPTVRTGWREELERARREALAAIARATSTAELEEVRVAALGRKGAITAFLRSLSQYPPEERPQIGRVANAVRDEVEAALDAAAERIGQEEEARRLLEETVDVTLPGTPVATGHAHPLNTVIREIEDIFLSMGFELAEGPEIETDAYNFEALNIPKGHPARDMQDSFYMNEGILLRTHTSPMQVRFMQSRAPDLPVRMITVGRVYRRDDDATHSPMFTQVEGLLVDRGVHLGHLKWTLEEFARRVYGEGARIRLRPSYFPFTEPSMEVDVSCTICGGGGCRTCKGTGWLEILGAGMVHPRVIRNGGYDPDEVSGFAFGMGPERIAMLKYGIDDLRLFFQNDLRFLEQF
ncbi:MAG: phenylalanine--tRNA ligase subunit alpha [Firmicutes bacterium]|nr:phenylalanine--tRNA ligase subunit alpha [Bacillota bacterium]